MVIIKKYGNRRLYDSARSRYINLEELAGIIRAGEAVQVVDAKTNEDLTHEVLMQVVLEVLKGDALLPTTLLRRLIRLSSDDPVQALVRKQFIAGLELLHTQLDRVEQVMGLATAGMPPGANPFERFTAKASAPSPAQAPEPEPEPEEAPPPAAKAPPTGEAGEVDALRARLDALEKRLKKG
jgi:polyhydroxyalkanoate synthesis repressor PhaR